MRQRSSDCIERGEYVQRSKENLGAENNLEPVIEPALERPLLNLHRAMDVNSFWRAVQQVLSVSIPSHAIRLTLQHNPILPLITRWTRPMPTGFFGAEPLRSYFAGKACRKFVRVGDLFSSRGSLLKSVFYRRYMKRQKFAHGIVLSFWKRRRLICGIAIMRSAKQGDFSPAELRLLRELYPQFMAALCRLGALEREHSVRMELEEFLRQLPLPTIILQWNLRPIYQNWAARDFCAVWEKGPEHAKRTKATSPIPSEILDRCRLLKQQWLEAERRALSKPRRIFKEEQVRHSRLPHLRATIRLKHIKSAGVARPHFLIECEDSCHNGGTPARLVNSRLPALARLTAREQEVARLVCNGQSNKEIADAAHLSVAMVKKHIHAIFRKLEVPSRSRLVAMML
jgi:DNA-binding CsgD family transcriptional regulator